MQSKISVQNVPGGTRKVKIKHMTVGTYFINDSGWLWLKIDTNNLCFAVRQELFLPVIANGEDYREVVDVQVNWSKKYEED